MKLETPIWVDQLCINQQDSEEKVEQLAIMAQIYGSASTVIIWLGTLSTVRSWGLDFMEDLPEHPVRITRVESDTSQQWSLLGKINRSFKAAKEMSSSLGMHSRWIAALLVLARDWFDRIWTLQEFMLATRFKMFMGNREVSQRAILRAATQLTDFYASDSLSIHMGLNHVANQELRSILQNRTKLFAERNAFQNGRRYTAEEFLGIARRKEATLPKDLVFAGAALLEQSVPNQIDYFSTTRDIYWTFTTERLWPKAGIRSLSLVGGASPKIEGLPSWTPDLSTEMIPEPLRYCGGRCFPSQPAMSASEFKFDGQTLHVKAAKWNSVRQIGETLWSWTMSELQAYNTEDGKSRMKTSTTSLQERFGLMFQLLDGAGTTYEPTGERTVDALWITLLGGATLATGDAAVWRDRFYHFFALTFLSIRSGLRSCRDDTSGVPDPWKIPLVQDLPHLEERVSSFLELFGQPSEGDAAPPLKEVVTALAERLYCDDARKAGFGKMRALLRGDPALERASMFGNLLTTIYDGRRIFSTENGYLGISSEDVKSGDVILLVAGADVPYVFRPAEGLKATFTLVGEAYLHGLDMDGPFETGLEFSDIMIV